jgi:hypothetical protein
MLFVAYVPSKKEDVGMSFDEEEPQSAVSTKAAAAATAATTKRAGRAIVLTVARFRNGGHHHHLLVRAASSRISAGTADDERCCLDAATRALPPPLPACSLSMLTLRSLFAWLGSQPLQYANRTPRRAREGREPESARVLLLYISGYYTQRACI